MLTCLDHVDDKEQILTSNINCHNHYHSHKFNSMLKDALPGKTQLPLQQKFPFKLVTCMLWSPEQDHPDPS